MSKLLVTVLFAPVSTESAKRERHTDQKVLRPSLPLSNMTNYKADLFLGIFVALFYSHLRVSLMCPPSRIVQQEILTNALKKCWQNKIIRISCLRLCPQEFSSCFNCMCWRRRFERNHLPGETKRQRDNPRFEDESEKGLCLISAWRLIWVRTHCGGRDFPIVCGEDPPAPPTLNHSWNLSF